MSVYFNKNTEDAIIEYNGCEDLEIKNKIYEEKIHPAFYKLSENLIHSFKFYYTEVDDLEHLKHEVEVFLLSKIHRFDPAKGFKAYSYFGTIGKRYLILYNTKNYKKRVESSPVDGFEGSDIKKQIPDVKPTSSIERLSYYIDEYVKYCTDNIYVLFPNEIDAKVADAILELFRKRENLSNIKKKALYIYIKDQIDVKTQKITKVVNKLFDIYYENYVFYIENDYIDKNFPLRFSKKKYV